MEKKKNQSLVPQELPTAVVPMLDPDFSKPFYILSEYTKGDKPTFRQKLYDDGGLVRDK